MQYIEQRKFRDEVLEQLVALYQGLDTPDYVNMCQCLIHLDKPHEVASILDKLIRNDSLKSEAMVSVVFVAFLFFIYAKYSFYMLLTNVCHWRKLTFQKSFQNV